MRLELESTPEIVKMTSPGPDGVPCRVWKGKTGRGVPVVAFVAVVAVSKRDDARELEAELLEQPPPAAAADFLEPPTLERRLVLSAELVDRIEAFVAGDLEQAKFLQAVIEGTLIGLERARFRPRAKAATAVVKKPAREKGVSVEKIGARARGRVRK